MQQDHTTRVLVAPTERLPVGGRLPEEDTVRIESGNSDSPPPELNGNSLFEHYAIRSKIGSGGMGVVYLARDRRLERYVAIKRLTRQAQSVPALRQRFLHEARAVATLSHVHIVHIYALGEDQDGPFIVMEYVEGPDRAAPSKEGSDAGVTLPNAPLTLDQHLFQRGHLTTEEATELLMKIGRAVAYAHASGVIHRDLKPTNILLDKSGEPKIVDFGLARVMHREESKLTVPGEKLLSLGYGAPEQESDASLSDERADVYGLGALLYFVLTGQNPRYFREQDVPAQLRAMTARALATDRERRWQSVAAFLEELHKAQTTTKAEEPTVKTTWRCKWCDAVNPLTLKHCADCGWDGTESCSECGEPTFVGVQYCGNCGADARGYETVLRALIKMREMSATQRFEKVVAHAGRMRGFEAAGPAGRRLLDEVDALRQQAEQSIARRAQLQEQIPMEMRVANYERVAAFIKQYREVSGEKQAFETELRQLPELTLQRDLARARKAVNDREWGLAERICQRLRREVAPDSPDVKQILGVIRRRALARRGVGMGAALCGVILLYLLLLPPIARMAKQPVNSLVRGSMRPAAWFYDQGGDNALLKRYARLWLLDDDTLRSWNAMRRESSPALTEGGMEPPAELKAKKQEYEQQLRTIAREQAEFGKAWPLEYLRELDTMMERRQAAGDFEGWAVVQAERNQFEADRRLDGIIADERSELGITKTKYREMIAEQRLVQSRKAISLCKKYVNELTDMQRIYTQEGRMEVATVINAEIKRVRGMPEQVEAERVLSELNATGAQESESSGSSLLVPAPKLLEEIALAREQFQRELVGVEKKSAAAMERWPEGYVSKLEEMMDKFQRAGDYTGWDSVRSEIARFEVDRDLLEKDVVQHPAELAALQREQVAFRETRRVERAKALLDVAERYIRSLQEQQRGMTVAGRMEAAAAVNNEIRRIRSRVDVIEAHNEIAPQGPPAPTDILIFAGDAQTEIFTNETRTQPNITPRTTKSAEGVENDRP